MYPEIFFDKVNLTLKIRFLHFLTSQNYVYKQNTLISFQNVDFGPNIYLIVYPSLENLKTHIAIMYICSTFCSYPFGPLDNNDDNLEYIKEMVE